MKKWLLILYLALILVIATGSMGGCLQAKAQLPAINSFNASPASITAGASPTLSWNVSGAINISIDQGIGEVALTGNRAVLPGATTIYTLKATNSAGSVTATTQIIVTGASSSVPSADIPAINSFAVSPNTITAGNSATLSWSVSNAVSVTIDQGIGAVAASASRSVYPTASTIYTLIATNTAGSVPATTQVIVTGSSTTPPPPPPAFAVTGVTAIVDPPSYTGACPKNYNCSAVITVNGPGTGTYRWERSDGGSSPLQTINFGSAGSQAVTTGWSRNTTGNHWVRVRILTPNEMVSNQANFTLTCQQPFVVTDVNVTSIPAVWTGPCPKTFDFFAHFTVNGPGTVTYRWERSDGGASPTQSVTCTSAGAITSVRTGWPREASGSYWVHVRILTPNEMVSNQANFTLTCE